MIENIKNTTLKKAVFMLIGNIIMAIGVAMFKLSGMGCDPFNGMNMQLSTHLPISYATLQALVNVFLFIVQIIWAGRMIGIGTVFNAFLTGYIVTFFHGAMLNVLSFSGIAPRLIIMLVGVIICSLGLSLYQRSNTGVAPLDSMPFVLERFLPKLSFPARRMMTDGTCALIGILAGGIAGGNLGIGSLICVFGFGPMIQFFDKAFVERLLPDEKC